jgi:CheY-like chemotaxis protein
MMQSGTESACVLVVDDEEDVRETLRDLVEMCGCSAIVASNGAEALELLAERRPCMVILDLLMPVMSGAEMLEAMRREPALAELPVVISTSAPERAPAGVPVLKKPLDIDSFMAWLRRNCECVVPALS